MKTNNKLIELIQSISDRAHEHPCCDHDLLAARDIDGICERGGDVTDWTLTAMEADGALKQLGVQPRN